MSRVSLVRLLMLVTAVTGCAVHAASPATAGSAPAPPAADAADVIQLDTTARWVRALVAWSDESAHRWTNDSLRTVLLAMAHADQEARRALPPERLADTGFVHRMTLVDSANARQLRDIIARFGWPTKSIVGAAGASAAWMIVQHSPALQEEGERPMLAAAPGEVSPADLAMLIDRRLVSRQRPQRFGSQLRPFASGETSASFYPIEDLAGLEQRRADAGLPPMAEYIRMLESMYHVTVVPPTGAGATRAEPPSLP